MWFSSFYIIIEFEFGVKCILKDFFFSCLIYMVICYSFV